MGAAASGPEDTAMLEHCVQDMDKTIRLVHVDESPFDAYPDSD
jgi:hypothetical protein